MFFCCSNKPFTMEYVIFCDFDGTITLQDTGKKLLNALTDKDWQYYDKLVINGSIGTRAALVKQWGMIDYTTLDEINSIVDSIKIDPSFIKFYEWIKENKLGFIIVSDGFEAYIKRILWKHQIDIPEDQIKANDMSLINNKIKLQFLTEQCEHGCANCKYSHVRKFKADNIRIVYIGDGLSDIFPAKELADIIFAKEGEDLANKLQGDKRLHTFSDFEKIKTEMENVV